MVHKQGEGGGYILNHDTRKFFLNNSQFTQLPRVGRVPYISFKNIITSKHIFYLCLSWENVNKLHFKHVSFSSKNMLWHKFQKFFVFINNLIFLFYKIRCLRNPPPPPPLPHWHTLTLAVNNLCDNITAAVLSFQAVAIFSKTEVHYTIFYFIKTRILIKNMIPPEVRYIILQFSQQLTCTVL